MKSFYIASKTQHAQRWQSLRDSGVNIISTWIDEARQGESSDLSNLSDRCIREASCASVTVLYCEEGEILKGALLEVGASLARGKEVRSVGNCPSISQVFLNHPQWKVCKSLEEAFS